MINSSIINSEASTIQQAVVPQGVNLISNSSPTLPAITGALALDVTSSGQLLMGNGTHWTIVASQGGFTGSSNLISGAGNHFASAGSNPDIGIVAITLQLITLSGQSLVYFDITCDASSAGATTPDTFTANIAIPSAYHPVNGKQFPVFITNNTTPISASLVLNTAGTFIINFYTTATGANLNVVNMSGVYSLSN